MSSTPDVVKEKDKDKDNGSETGVSTLAPGTSDEITAPAGPSEEDNAGGTVEMIDDKAVFKPTREFLLAFSALCVVSLAVAFDATSISVALPIMSSELGGTALEAFWSGTSFLLASTVLQPTVAALSNIFGRKYVCCPRDHAVGSVVDANHMCDWLDALHLGCLFRRRVARCSPCWELYCCASGEDNPRRGWWWSAGAYRGQYIIIFRLSSRYQTTYNI